MPERHEVVMQMVLELEQGTIDSDVARMMEGVVGAIERAFAGLGDKLAQEMMRGLETVQGQVGGNVGMMGGGQSPFLTGGPEGLHAPAVPPPPPGAEPYTSTQTATNTTAPHLAATRGGYIDPFVAPAGAMAPLLSQFDRPPPGLDSELAMVRSRQMAISAGIADPFSEEEIDRVGKIRGEYQATMQSGLTRQRQKEAEINFRLLQGEQYQADLGGLTAGSEAHRQTAQINEENYREIERLREEIKGLTETMRGASRAIDELGKISERQQGMGMLAQGVGMAAAVATFGGQLPRALRAGQVGAAQVQNLEARALFDEDYSRALAISHLGGQEAITGGARGEAALSIAGHLGSGITAMLASPFTGAFAPATAMAGLGLAGQGAMQAVQFDAAVAQRAEEAIQAKIQKDREAYQALPMATAFTTQAFRGAQGLGVTGQADFFTAGAGQYRDQLAAQEEIQRLENQLAGTPTTIPGEVSYYGGTGTRGPSVANPRIAELQGKIATAQQAAQEAGGGLTQFGVQNAFMTPEMVQQMLMRSAGGLGGFFQGGPEGGMLGQMTPELQDIMMMQAHGLGNAPELAGAFFAGGTGRGGQLEQRQGAVGDLRAAYEMARNAGLDLTAVPGFMQGMGARAAGIGLGGREVAMREAGVTLGRGQALFGQAGISAPQMQALQRIENRISSESTVGRGGLGEITGLRLAADLSSEFLTPEVLGREVTSMDQQLIAGLGKTATAESMARALGIDPNDKEKVAEIDKMLKAQRSREATYGQEQKGLAVGGTGKEELGTRQATAALLMGEGSLEERLLQRDIALGIQEPSVTSVPGEITDDQGRPIGTRKPFGIGDKPAAGQPAELVGANVRVAAIKLAGGMENLGEQITVVTQGLFQLHQRIQTLVRAIGPESTAGGMSVGTAALPSSTAVKSSANEALGHLGMTPNERMTRAPE